MQMEDIVKNEVVLTKLTIFVELLNMDSTRLICFKGIFIQLLVVYT